MNADLRTEPPGWKCLFQSARHPTLRPEIHGCAGPASGAAEGRPQSAPVREATWGAWATHLQALVRDQFSLILTDYNHLRCGEAQNDISAHSLNVDHGFGHCPQDLRCFACVCRVALWLHMPRRRSCRQSLLLRLEERQALLLWTLTPALQPKRSLK